MTHRWEFNVKYLNQGKDVTILHGKLEDQNLTPKYSFIYK